MRAGEPELKCPTCGKTVPWRSPAESPHFPFCSERCKLIDLGKWFDGEHRIEEPIEPEEGGPASG